MSVTGVNNILASYQYDNKIQRTGTRNDVMLHKSSYSTKTDFVKQLQNTAESKQSFQDMWQTRFSGAYYHVMNAYKISSGSWGRYDFPHEQFFQENVDESVLDWKPTGTEPKLTDRSVQSRINTTLGKKAIVVPPALEEKMNNNPALAQKVMEKVERFIVNDEATLPTGRIYSCVVVLDENGEIAHAAGSSGGGNITGPTEEEQRQFLEERKEEAKKAAEYRAMLEESALKRSVKWQEIHAEYYRQRIYNRVLENYESGTLL